MNVFCTTDSRSHAAYGELAATPPDGVVYTWMRRHTEGVARSGRETARALFRFVRMPNIRLLPPAAVTADVVHSCQQLLLTRWPWVVDIEHGQPFVGTEFSRLNHSLTRSVILALIGSRRCRAILPWTETAARAFSATFHPPDHVQRKVTVVSPAIRSAARRRTDATRQGCRLLFVANSPEYNAYLKGGRELVLAFQALASSGEDVSLTIVGPAPASFIDWCRSTERITLTGPVPREHLDQLYQGADIYVMPSLSDTFGMVFLEAMAHGLPVVAVDRPYTKDIIRDGVNGALVRPSDHSVRWCDSDGRFTMNSEDFIARVVASTPDEGLVTSLVQRLRPLVRDGALRQQLGEAGRIETLTGRFSSRHRNSLLERAYMAALDGSTGSVAR